MLCGARLQQAWHHARAHRFFSAARWSADQLGLVLLDLICALLVADGAPVRLVADDTLMRRSGRKIFGAAWHHDPLAPGRHRIAWANNWVVVGVLAGCRSSRTAACACRSWPACGSRGTPRDGSTWPPSWSGWSAPTSAPAPRRPGR